MQIFDFTDDYAGAFEALNREWLEKYFYVEDIDRRILSNPQAEIIDPGGHILFAGLGDKKLYLESHSSLTTAIGLYESAGFVHMPHPEASDYARSDTYMLYQPDIK